MVPHLVWSGSLLGFDLTLPDTVILTLINVSRFVSRF